MGAMSADVGVSPVAAGAASIINTNVNIATGMAVGVISGSAILAEVIGVDPIWAWALAVLATLGVLTLPVLVPWVFRVARRFGARIPDQHVPARVIVVSATANIVAWGMYGIAFLCLNRGLVELPSYDALQHIAVNATSYVAGYLVLIVPGGLGVREGVLQRVMVTAGMADPAQAVAVSLISRLWQLIIMITPALIFFAYRRPPNEKDDAAG
jgi:uncharacterized membrane protein YbhN (UPF0104 family)